MTVTTPILGDPMLGPEAAARWAAGRGATNAWCEVAHLYWEAPARATGVRPDVAWAQACKETGFGKFGRAVTPAHKNPCGLKVPAPVGPDDNPDDHCRFGSWERGVQAHVEHLALYAGAPGFPLTYEKVSPFLWKGATADPRHFSFIFGRAGNSVEGLSGNWAPAAAYGPSIVNDYLAPMIRFAWGQ